MVNKICSNHPQSDIAWINTVNTRLILARINPTVFFCIAGLPATAINVFATLMLYEAISWWKMKTSFSCFSLTDLIALLVDVAHRKHISVRVVSVAPGVANKCLKSCRGRPMMSGLNIRVITFTLTGPKSAFGPDWSSLHRVDISVRAVGVVVFTLPSLHPRCVGNSWRTSILM